MKNNNKAESTIKFTDKALTFIAKHTTLKEPEAVKALIANLTGITDGYKKNLRSKTIWEAE
jgi:hypothetical protein